MAEKPIIFSGEMVRAILDGRKTQTRRIVNPPIMNVWGQGVPNCQPSHYCVYARIASYGEPDTWIKCPYGKPGDLLWVRETWKYKDFGLNWVKVKYRADSEIIKYSFDKRQPFKGKNTWNWQPSIFMPRWASRITLKITGVRVERLQDISEQDAIAEGCKPWKGVPGDGERTARQAFVQLWNSINAKRGYSWGSNPWVWVVEFSYGGTHCS